MWIVSRNPYSNFCISATKPFSKVLNEWEAVLVGQPTTSLLKCDFGRKCLLKMDALNLMRFRFFASSYPGQQSSYNCRLPKTKQTPPQSRIRALSQTVLCIRVFLFLSLKYKWWQASKISSSTKPTITEKGQLELLSFYLQNYAGLQNNSLKHKR